MTDLLFLIQQMLFFSMPLLIVAIGGLFSEKSGVINIALEGLMVFGAFTGILFLYFIGDALPGQLSLVIAMVFASLGGGLLASMHAYASISKKANQSISGMAINIFAAALAVFVAKELTPSELIPFNNIFYIDSVPFLGKIPILGPILFQKAYITSYVTLIIFFVSLFIFTKTRLGLRIRAAGECPDSVAVAGLNVKKLRYIGVILSGVFAGLGGIVFFIPTSVEFSANVSGYGFLGIAVVVFSQWKIKRVIWSALFFGLMQTIASTYSGISFLQGLSVIPAEFLKMLPYVATILILSFSYSGATAPSALGEPFDAAKR